MNATNHTMSLRCMIVDDEPIARKLLQEYIEDISFLELKGTVENALKANQLLNSEPIDLLFLDINMPKLTGLEFLRTVTSSPMVIMTTAYAEYAADGFELDVLDYLVKPFSFERFLKACNKAKEYHELKTKAVADATTENDYFFVKRDGRIEKVFYDELVYIEAMLNYVVLHTTNGKMVVYHTIRGILEQLPSDIFLKVHKSSIINIKKVKSIEGNTIDLGVAKVTVSHSAFETAMKTILKDRMIKR
ncbi:LytR/AlgR family response regulator transcription factor [Puia sp. P3]|uniref:LytR/AlgR family response regulator transcription factor n=1 Tax=Puia sp. P3 TaxID=3423952 RepID=UPI003D67AC25